MSSFNFLRRILPLAVMGVISAGVSGAAQAYLANPGTCTTDSFSLNHMETSPPDGAGVIFTGLDVYTTSCFGLVEGNDQGGMSAPDPNIGELYDGLLNGQLDKDGNEVLSPTQFLTSPSQLLDLDGDGNATDPGWIYLGSVEGGGDTSYVMDGYNKPLNIDDILSVTMTCTAAGDDACVAGEWTLETELDIIDKVQAVLGRNSFDHLAFVIKAGTSWAVYDFDFNILLEQLLALGGGGFDYVTPYSFAGAWNTDDFLNAQGSNPQSFSHISVWARDPMPQDVPLPGTLALVGAGLAALGLGLRRS